jgi:hypothetical protein
MLLPSRCTYHSALCNKCLIALSGKFHIVLRRFPGPFLECMEHIDRFHKLGDVAYAMFHLGMNSDLTDPGTNARHRFPVQWLQPLLNQPKLKARESPDIPRECLQVTPRGPEPQDRLFGHDVNMQVLVYSSQERRAFREHRTNVGVLPTFLIVRPQRARKTVLGASTYIYGVSELARTSSQVVVWIYPFLRASNEHILIVRVPRARGIDQTAPLPFFGL